MGVDVNLYAKGNPTDEQVQAASKLLASRLDRFIWPPDEDYPEGVISRVEWDDGDVRWEVNTSSRYYGPGYERGHWPDIYAAIRCLRSTLPNCTIHYGGDSDDACPEATDDYLAHIWRHWLGASGNAYFDA